MVFGLFESEETKKRKALNKEISVFKQDVAKEVGVLGEIKKLDDEKCRLLSQVSRLWTAKWGAAKTLVKNTIPVLINKELFFSRQGTSNNQR